MNCRKCPLHGRFSHSPSTTRGLWGMVKVLTLFSLVLIDSNRNGKQDKIYVFASQLFLPDVRSAQDNFHRF